MGPRPRDRKDPRQLSSRLGRDKGEPERRLKNRSARHSSPFVVRSSCRCYAPRRCHRSPASESRPHQHRSEREQVSNQQPKEGAGRDQPRLRAVSLHELGKPMLSVDGDDDSAACVDLDGSLEIADPQHGAGYQRNDPKNCTDKGGKGEHQDASWESCQQSDDQRASDRDPGEGPLVRVHPTGYSVSEDRE